MKKLFSLIACLSLAIGLAGCANETEPQADTKFTAGTYTAEAQGFHGAVKVSVEVDADKIIKVDVT